MEKHTHQCGFTSMGFDPSKGCGHEWEHDDLMLLAPSHVYQAEHHCPACGKGPWTWKSNMKLPRTIEEMDDEGAELIVSLLRLITARRRV